MKKNQGKEFESQFEDSVKKFNYPYVRLVDAQKWIQSSDTKFTPKNICDLILFATPKLMLLELKSCGGTSISFKAHIEGQSYPWDTSDKKQYDIKPSQVASLKKYINFKDVIPGFIFNFRARDLKTKSEENEAYFLHLDEFLAYARMTGAGSINRAGCHDYGTLLPCKKKIKKYTYDIPFLDNHVKERCYGILT